MRDHWLTKDLLQPIGIAFIDLLMDDEFVGGCAPDFAGSAAVDVYSSSLAWAWRQHPRRPRSLDRYYQFNSCWRMIRLRERHKAHQNACVQGAGWNWRATASTPGEAPCAD